MFFFGDDEFRVHGVKYLAEPTSGVRFHDRDSYGVIDLIRRLDLLRVG